MAQSDVKEIETNLNTPVKKIKPSQFHLSRNSAQKLAPINHFKTEQKLSNEKEDMSYRTGISTVNNMPTCNLKKIDKKEGRFKEKQAHTSSLRQIANKADDSNAEQAKAVKRISQSKPDLLQTEPKPVEKESEDLDKFSDARLFEEIMKRMN